MGRSEATRRSDTPTRTPRRSALWMTIPTGLVLAAAMGAVPDPGTPTTASQEEGVAMGWDRASPVALVTGSTGGLGREVALRLGGEGYHVIVHGRNRERGMEVVRAIEEAGPGTASLHVADLASLEDTRALARAVLEGYDRLDVLVNNAGIWLEPEAGRVLNEDGHELHFHVNYLAHFLLTELLLDRVVASAPSRIVHVSSVAQRAIDFDDVMLEEGYSDGRAYAQSKLAQILHTYDLARDLEGTGVTVNALHPATMMDTDMVLARGAQPRASVEEGVEAALNLILSPGVEHGRYYNGLTPVRANDQAYDAEARARLRTLSLRLTGLEP